MRFDIVVEWYNADREVDVIKTIRFSGTLADAKKRCARELEALWYKQTEGGLIPEVARVDEVVNERTVAVFDWDADFEVAKERIE